MIKTQDAIRVARFLIGTPYSEMDCIALIRAVIRQSPGGVKDYRCEGTNWLWDSVKNSGKYRHLTERHEGVEGIPAGALPFKRYGADGEDHVGIATGEGTVIHSSSVKGRVVETPLTAKEGWDCWGKHRYIETAGDTQESEGNDMAAMHRARVVTEIGSLNVRQVPEVGKVIAQIPKGEIVNVYTPGDWPRIRWGEVLGYASSEYLEKIEELPQEEELQGETQGAFTSLRREEDGAVIMLAGKWSAVND